MKPTRRGFLAGVLGLVAAPAIVRATSLMPVSPIPVEQDNAFRFAQPLPYNTYEPPSFIVMSPSDWHTLYDNLGGEMEVNGVKILRDRWVPTGTAYQLPFKPRVYEWPPK